MPESCVFCRIWSGKESAEGLWRRDRVMGFVPLNPVVPGHKLVVPAVHVVDALEHPGITAEVMAAAAAIARRPCNIITSAGREATQTVFHFHIHIVPRHEGDGLALPWTAQQGEGHA